MVCILIHSRSGYALFGRTTVIYLNIQNFIGFSSQNQIFKNAQAKTIAIGNSTIKGSLSNNMGVIIFRFPATLYKIAFYKKFPCFEAHGISLQCNKKGNINIILMAQ
jgi:hypothetical protein